MAPPRYFPTLYAIHYDKIKVGIKRIQTLDPIPIEVSGYCEATWGAKIEAKDQYETRTIKQGKKSIQKLITNTYSKQVHCIDERGSLLLQYDPFEPYAPYQYMASLTVLNQDDCAVDRITLLQEVSNEIFTSIDATGAILEYKPMWIPREIEISLDFIADTKIARWIEQHIRTRQRKRKKYKTTKYRGKRTSSIVVKDYPRPIVDGEVPIHRLEIILRTPALRRFDVRSVESLWGSDWTQILTGVLKVIDLDRAKLRARLSSRGLKGQGDTQKVLQRLEVQYSKRGIVGLARSLKAIGVKTDGLYIPSQYQDILKEHLEQWDRMTTYHNPEAIDKYLEVLLAST